MFLRYRKSDITPTHGAPPVRSTMRVELWQNVFYSRVRGNKALGTVVI